MPIEITPEIQALIDQQVGAAVRGLKSNRDALLDEKKKLQTKLEDLSYDDKIRRDMADHANVDISAPANAAELTISREDARDVQKYRSARQRAANEGKRLVVTDSAQAAPQARTPSRVKSFETDTHVFVNLEQQKRIGLVRAHAEASSKGKQYQAFTYVDDLPSEAAAKHARIVAAGDPEHMLHVEP